MSMTFELESHKLKHMESAAERTIARKYWRAMDAVADAEQQIDAFYTPLLHSCATKEEAITLLMRVPDSIQKGFFNDYILFARDWSKTHEESDLARREKRIAAMTEKSKK